MKYEILATGSSGNCMIINEEIAIDIGIPWKKLKPYAKNLKLVLLTHAHGDHFKPETVAALHRERPRVMFGCCEWMIEPLLKAGVKKRAMLLMHPENSVLTYPNVVTALVDFIHHDVPNCAWRLTLPDKTRVFYATDCSALEGIEAYDYDYYFIEANHKEDEIQARIAEKQAAGQFSYEIRAAKYHLSQEKAEKWLAENGGPNNQYVFLHQHRGKALENNENENLGVK